MSDTRTQSDFEIQPKYEPPQGPIKAGDTIRHVPSREKWTVAARQGEYIICCGWPETMAPITDCDLIRSCTEEEEVKQLRETANIRGQTRGAWARATLQAKGLV